MVEVEGVHRALNDVLVVVVASSGSWLGLGGGRGWYRFPMKEIRIQLG